MQEQYSLQLNLPQHTHLGSVPAMEMGFRRVETMGVVREEGVQTDDAHPRGAELRYETHSGGGSHVTRLGVGFPAPVIPAVSCVAPSWHPRVSHGRRGSDFAGSHWSCKLTRDLIFIKRYEVSSLKATSSHHQETNP